MTDDQIFTSLAKAKDTKEAAEAQMRDAVQEARGANYPWVKIGEALGISRQAAWERYKHVEGLTRDWDWDAHKGGPEGHLAICAHSNCSKPAKWHVRWGYGCANLCGIHERSMTKRGMGSVFTSEIRDIHDPGTEG